MHVQRHETAETRLWFSLGTYTLTLTLTLTHARSRVGNRPSNSGKKDQYHRQSHLRPPPPTTYRYTAFAAPAGQGQVVIQCDGLESAVCVVLRMRAIDYDWGQK